MRATCQARTLNFAGIVGSPISPGAAATAFGDHLDRVARALFEANGAARAEVVVDTVESARAELNDRLLRTGGVAIVAFKAVAAGQAAACLVTRLGLGQAARDFLESLALGDRSSGAS